MTDLARIRAQVEQWKERSNKASFHAATPSFYHGEVSAFCAVLALLPAPEGERCIAWRFNAENLCDCSRCKVAEGERCNAPTPRGAEDMTDGMKLRKIAIAGADAVYEAGMFDVVDMTVELQNGQMAAVPWVRVLFDDGRVRLYNAAHLLFIEPREEPTP